MQNTHHTHAWDQTLHMAPDTVREIDLSRNFLLNHTGVGDFLLSEVAPDVAYGMLQRESFRLLEVA